MQKLFDLLKKMKDKKDTRELEDQFISILNSNQDLNLNEIYNREGLTLLYCAAQYGNARIVKELLARNADPNLENRSDIGSTPLMVSIRNDQGLVFEQLMTNLKENGRKPKFTDKQGASLFHYAIMQDPKPYLEEVYKCYPDSFDKPDNKGQTPLMFGIKNKGNRESLLFLINEPNINAKDNKGRTALDLALEYYSDFDPTGDITVAMLKRGAKGEALKRIDPIKLIKKGKSELFIYLINQRLIDLKTITAKSKMKAFFYAIESDKSGAILKELLKRFPRSVNMTRDGETLIHAAISHQNFAAIKILLEDSNLDLKATDMDGDTPQSLARAFMLHSVVRQIVDYRSENSLIGAAHHRTANYKRDVDLVKMTGHILELRSAIPVYSCSSVHKKLPVTYKSTEGSSDYESLEFIIAGLKTLTTETKMSDEDRKIHDEILKGFERAFKFSSFEESLSNMAEQFIKEFNDPENPQIEIFPIGTENHALGLALYKDHLIYCNRGGGTPKGLLIFNLTPQQKERITKDWVLKLFPENKFLTQEEVNDILSEVVNLKNPDKEIEIRKQKVGNCTYDNRMGLYKGLMYLKKMELIPTGKSPESKGKKLSELTDLEDTHLRKTAKIYFDNVSTFLRNYNINHLIAVYRETQKFRDSDEFDISNDLQVRGSKFSDIKYHHDLHKHRRNKFLEAKDPHELHRREKPKFSAANDFHELYMDLAREIISTLENKWGARAPKKIEQDLNRFLLLLQELDPKSRKSVISDAKLASSIFSQSMNHNNLKLAKLLLESMPSLSKDLPADEKRKLGLSEIPDGHGGSPRVKIRKN